MRQRRCPWLQVLIRVRSSRLGTYRWLHGSWMGSPTRPEFQARRIRVARLWSIQDVSLLKFLLKQSLRWGYPIIIERFWLLAGVQIYANCGVLGYGDYSCNLKIRDELRFWSKANAQLNIVIFVKENWRITYPEIAQVVFPSMWSGVNWATWLPCIRSKG